jgi:hypothetical protein
MKYPGPVLLGISAILMLTLTALSALGFVPWGPCGPGLSGLLLMLGFLFTALLGVIFSLVQFFRWASRRSRPVE